MTAGHHILEIWIAMSWLSCGRHGKNLFFAEFRKIHSMGKMDNIRVRSIQSWKFLHRLKEVHSLRLSETQREWGFGQPILYLSSGQEKWRASKPPAQLHAPIISAPVERRGDSKGKGSLGLPTDHFTWTQLALTCWTTCVHLFQPVFCYTP